MLGDEKVNNYSDYYSYMNNYMNGTNYTQVPNNINYQNFDNNTFANNFMMPSVNNNELVDPSEGLERGNLFKNLYDPYKNYKSMQLNPNSKREQLLNQILSYNFAMKDLNLYLDMNPNDTNYINLYNQYRKSKESLCNQYEKMYGPLNLMSDSLENNNWIWINSPWPWESEK